MRTVPVAVNVVAVARVAGGHHAIEHVDPRATASTRSSGPARPSGSAGGLPAAGRCGRASRCARPPSRPPQARRWRSRRNRSPSILRRTRAQFAVHPPCTMPNSAASLPACAIFERRRSAQRSAAPSTCAPLPPRPACRRRAPAGVRRRSSPCRCPAPSGCASIPRADRNTLLPSVGAAKVTPCSVIAPGARARTPETAGIGEDRPSQRISRYGAAVLLDDVRPGRRDRWKGVAEHHLRAEVAQLPGQHAPPNRRCPPA